MLRVISISGIALMALLTGGCSHPSAPPPPPMPTTPGPAGEAQQIETNPNLSPAQKEQMLSQLNTRQSAPPNGGG